MINKIIGTVIFFGTIFFTATQTVSADVYAVTFDYDAQNQQLRFYPEPATAILIDSTKTLSTHLEDQEYPNGMYEAVFTSVKGYEIARKRFDVVPGVFTVNFPYFSIAKTLNVYRFGSQELLLSHDIAEFTKCFMNGICEYEKGESLRTCISDCASDTLRLSPETQKILSQNNNVIRDPLTGEILLEGMKEENLPPTATVSKEKSSARLVWLIVSIVALFVGAVAAIYFVRKRFE